MAEDNVVEYKIAKDDDIVRTEEGLIFDPYNPLNVKIKQSNVEAILLKYGVTPIIHNMALYERAFVHRSYTKRPNDENLRQNIKIMPRPDDCMPLSSKSNERLEFLGDGVLELVTKFHLYRRFPKADEGFMTQKKIDIVKNEAIGKIAQEMKLQQWLIISKHAEEKNIRTNLKKLGCLFEAFIGALFLDSNKTIGDNPSTIKDPPVGPLIVKEGRNEYCRKLEVVCPERAQQLPICGDSRRDNAPVQLTNQSGIGFSVAMQFIENVFEQHINWTDLILNDNNYKTILQIKIQKEFKVTPNYLNIDPDFKDKISDDVNDRQYKMGVYLCLGQPIYTVTPNDAIHISQFKNFAAIHEYLAQSNGKIFMFIGEGQHRNKRKAEQIACNQAIKAIEQFK